MDTVEEAKFVAKSFVKLDLNQNFNSKPSYSNPFAKSTSLDLNQKSSFKPTTSQSSGKFLSFSFFVSDCEIAT